MTSAVRYAIHDEIMMFMVILKKIGKYLFINYINDKFDWIAEINKEKTAIGLSKKTIHPFHNKHINNS